MSKSKSRRKRERRANTTRTAFSKESPRATGFGGGGLARCFLFRPGCHVSCVIRRTRMQATPPLGRVCLTRRTGREWARGADILVS
jgi:hypothetical protein